MILKFQICLNFIIISTILNSCVVDTVDTRLKFVNNSISPLFVHREFTLIKDTMINCEGCYSKAKDNYFFLPKDTTRISFHGILCDEFLKKNKNQILRVFVISKDSLLKYGWEEVKTKEIVLKRYDVDINYLYDHNWTIVYP